MGQTIDPHSGRFAATSPPIDGVEETLAAISAPILLR